jgi:hypothetical protein
MYKFIKYAACFLITLFLLSCNNDELAKNQENASNVKKNLELNKFSNPNIVANVEVDFENVTEFEKDNFKISEIAAKEKVVNYFKSDLLQSQLKYQVITIEYENNSYSYFLEIYAHKKSAVYPNTITKLKDFSGTLNVYTFKGKNLGSIGLAKGMAKNISDKEDLNILTKAINLFSENRNLTNRIPPCNTPYFQPMQFMVSWYTETIVDGKPISYALTNTTTETIFVEMTYPCDASAPEVARAYRYEIIGHSGAGGSGITPPLPIQIIDQLTGKAKCLNDLLNKNGNSFVTTLLANFAGNSKFDISIVSKDKVTVTNNGVTEEINGKTIPPVGNLINIEISTSKANTNSSLDVARTILHEYIHADIFRKLGTNLGTDKESLDFKTTYEAYGNQHSTIAILYLNGMKEALKEFHKTVLTDDYNKYTQYYGEVPSDEFYEALAWGGLKDANVKAWTDLPATKKASIEALASRVPMLSKMTPCSN